MRSTPGGSNQANLQRSYNCRFWSSSERHLGRCPLAARLSVQISAVRRILGGGLIAARSSIRLDPELVKTDFVDFYAAAQRDPAHVVDLYQGELLREDLAEPWWTTGPRDRPRRRSLPPTLSMSSRTTA
jgi:hypothetical protein